MTKSVKVVFTISLLLNVLILGVFIGKGLDGKPDYSPEKRPWQKMKEELAPETLDVIKATFKGSKKEVLPLFKDVREKQEAMLAVLSAPEFDGEAYDALVGEFRDLNMKLVEGRMRTVKSIFSQLPQEEREKMAAHTVEKMMGKPPRHHERMQRRMEEGRMRNMGGIEAPQGRPPFDARSASEFEPNHSE